MGEISQGGASRPQEGHAKRMGRGPGRGEEERLRMASTTLDLRRGAATGRAAFLARQGANWVFLLPTLIFFIGWQVYPIFRVLWMSFTDYHFLRNQPSAWVGVQNYANALADPLVLTGVLP